jgi:hypothetical protein
VVVFRYLTGWYRAMWGWCPRCNSCAPEIDTCPVCKFGRWPDRTTEAVWERFAGRGYR